ncbi:MAG: PepSY1/2 domain-containing protein, partial [Bacilli bacterium]
IARAKAFAGAAARDPANVARLGSGFDAPGYMVTVRQPGHRSTAVGLTLRSGQILWMTTDEPLAGQARYTAGQGLMQADRFLRAHGYTNVVLKRQSHYGTTGTYTYAPLIKTVARESRLILVKVNLSDGRVTGFDASRAVGATAPAVALQPTISVAAARRDLSPGFTVLKTRLAILEPAGRPAILAYEFMGTSDGAAFEVWVNAHDGAVVAVDKLTKTELQKL